jgi:hypothetical protein
VTVRFPTILCLLCPLIPTALAEDQPAPVEHPQPSPVLPPKPVGHAPKRLFGIFPNYKATDAQATYTHPTVKEKFKIARQNSFDWPNYFLNAGYAIQNQVAQNGFSGPGFGKTFAEYYARAWADGVIGNYTTQAILPSMLGEDPRYLRLGAGSGWKRTWHAVSWVAVTKRTNGRNRIHLSELAGNAGVVAVTNLYYPSQNHDFGSGATRWGLALSNDAIANLLTEFLPDIEHKLRHKH